MTVYIVQEPRRVTKNKNGEVVDVRPAFDYSPALKFGEIRYILKTGNSRFSARQTVAEVKHGLKDFTEDDYILPSGDPGIIGVVIAVAARMTGGKIKILRWMREDRNYLEMMYDINQ